MEEPSQAAATDALTDTEVSFLTRRKIIMQDIHQPTTMPTARSV